MTCLTNDSKKQSKIGRYQQIHDLNTKKMFLFTLTREEEKSVLMDWEEGERVLKYLYYTIAEENSHYSQATKVLYINFWQIPLQTKALDRCFSRNVLPFFSFFFFFGCWYFIFGFLWFILTPVCMTDEIPLCVCVVVEGVGGGWVQHCPDKLFLTYPW